MIRARVMRVLKPSGGYFLATRQLQPLSSKFGFDRGTPIDRFWIDTFIEEHQEQVRDRVMEVCDDRYSGKYPQLVTKLDILDIDVKNKKATIYGDLRNLKDIADNTYDCVILTHVLGQIDDVQAAARELSRIIKPNGTLLLTSAAFSPTLEHETNYWRFTQKAMHYLFDDKFTHVKVSSLGNVLAGQCFWVGMAQEELTKKELEYRDERFQCVITVVAKK
ncbi:MAG TPA: methyltransferase domain-containing protein [Candidatus Saccharimonadia bacterium]|nr:methyltransferase domain-containing protein [Candidatus Saccharimonadia bacterium]